MTRGKFVLFGVIGHHPLHFRRDPRTRSGPGLELSDNFRVHNRRRTWALLRGT